MIAVGIVVLKSKCSLKRNFNPAN